MAILRGHDELEDIYIYGFQKALVEYYNLGSFDITAFPDDPEKTLENLERLDLSSNKFECIKEFNFTTNPKLKVLSFTGNFHIGTMQFPDFTNCKELEELYFSGSCLTDVSKLDLSLCTNLDTLDLSYNDLKDLKCSLPDGKIDKKLYVHLEQNPLNPICLPSLIALKHTKVNT